MTITATVLGRVQTDPTDIPTSRILLADPTAPDTADEADEEYITALRTAQRVMRTLHSRLLEWGYYAAAADLVKRTMQMVDAARARHDRHMSLIAARAMFRSRPTWALKAEFVRMLNTPATNPLPLLVTA